jgi:hypothetical protein
MPNWFRTFIPTILCLAIITQTNPSRASEKEYGVYEFVVRNAQGPYDQITADLRQAAEKAGWQVAAVTDAGQMEDCSYKARVCVLYYPAYVKAIMEANGKTGPFAVLDRINIFQDEDGCHVSIVNPHSITRTVLMDDDKYESLAEEHLQALRAMIASAVKGEDSKKQYGEIREKGYIGKTMGVVAGGRFDDKVEDEFVVAAGGLQDIAAKVETALKRKGKEWGTQLVFSLPLPEFSTVVFGTTGTPLDTKSFDIVGSGDDDARDKFQCPGLAHAAAYPIEVVVTKEGSDIKVRMVHAMFRMKMYFEDAGKWAFMKHMGMPGSIAGEITDHIRSELKTE